MAENAVVPMLVVDTLQVVLEDTDIPLFTTYLPAYPCTKKGLAEHLVTKLVIELVTELVTERRNGESFITTLFCCASPLRLFMLHACIVLPLSGVF
jgi:hypothetical protein